MQKRIFWPASLVTMGLVFLASNVGLLPREFWNLWPLMLIIVGLGGLLTSDRDEWLSEEQASTKRSTSTKKRKTKKKSAPKNSKKKK